LLPSQPVYFPTLYPTLFTTHPQIYLLPACHTTFLSLCLTLFVFFFFLLPTYFLLTIILMMSRAFSFLSILWWMYIAEVAIIHTTI
jgi:hypothetical protein